MNENKTIPVLLIEDDFVVNEIINEIADDIPELEVIIATTKKEALEILKSRNDFLIAFVDWHLEDDTSAWIIENIYATQSQILEIFATSTCSEKRKIQFVVEWATKEIEKHDIFNIIPEVPKIIKW